MYLNISLSLYLPLSVRSVFCISNLILHLQMPKRVFCILIAFSSSRVIQLEMWNFTIQGYIQSVHEFSSQSRGSEQRSQDVYTVKQITSEPYNDT